MGDIIDMGSARVATSVHGIPSAGASLFAARGPPKLCSNFELVIPGRRDHVPIPLEEENNVLINERLHTCSSTIKEKDPEKKNLLGHATTTNAENAELDEK